MSTPGINDPNWYEWYVGLKPQHGIDETIRRLLPLAGKESFWQLVRTIGYDLSGYDYQISSRNMQFLLIRYFEGNAERMAMLFDRELTAQEQWATGNGHIPMDAPYEPHIEQFSEPVSFVEMVLYILLEQLETYNARRMEAALFALYRLGKRFPSTIEAIITAWPQFTALQKDYMLLIIARLVNDGVDLRGLTDILLEEYKTCDQLSRLYCLHSILLLMGSNGVDQDVVCYAPSYEYAYRAFAFSRQTCDAENFLRLADKYNVSPKITNGIRDYIAQHSEEAKYRKDRYAQIGDLRITMPNPLIDRILYHEEKNGSWAGIPLLMRKSRLLPPEDPFILLDMPQVVYDEKWFPNINSDDRISEQQMSSIARYGLSSRTQLLAAYVFYPWGHKDGAILFETAKIYAVDDLRRDYCEAWCLGNFGLLAQEGALDELDHSVVGICLFARIGGGIRFHFGNSQLVPTAAWRKMLGCTPGAVSPYIWVNEKGHDVLWLECFTSPLNTTLLVGQ